MDLQRLSATSTALKQLLGRLAVRSMATIRPAAQVLNDLGLSLGLRTATCANIASQAPMVDGEGAVLAAEVFGWCKPSERWWSRPGLALTSPLTIACRYEDEPFWCNKNGIYTQQVNPHLAGLDLSDFFARALTAGAIVIPLHLAYGQIGVVSFQSVDSERTDLSQEFADYAELLGVCARRFISSYVRVMTKSQWIASDVRLSKRENECLRWAAVGKTDGEIAVILSRSCATIRFHIHNAALKLNAVNRSQAVFKAGQLGYLSSAN